MKRLCQCLLVFVLTPAVSIWAQQGKGASDPFNGTGADRKAIPGAVIQYTIVVTNNSTTTAAGAVTVSDNIPANTTFVPGSITLNAGALPDSNFIAGPPARVVVSAGAVAASGGAATVTFRVTINN